MVPPLTIGERLQQLASSADRVAALSPSGGTPPLTYMEGDRMDPGRAYSTAGSAHSIPTSALVCMTTPMVEELNQLLRIHHWSHTCHNSVRLCYS